VVVEKFGDQQDRTCEKMKYYTESNTKATFCIQWNEGRLAGLVTKLPYKNCYWRKDKRAGRRGRRHKQMTWRKIEHTGNWKRKH